MYEVKLGEFSGPLEKLLELIEAKKLDITQITLAEVTGDFLAYVESLKAVADQAEEANDEEKKTVSMRMLADFLVVAAQLVLAKSKALLPSLELTQEEEEGINDLERRLKIYQELKPMFSATKNSWVQAPVAYSRTMLTAIAPVFYPPKTLTLSAMAETLGKLFTTLGTFLLEKETIKRQLYSLEEKVAEVTRKITEGISKFSQLVGKKAKDEAIVLFLALLHLLRDERLSVSQSGLFDEINISQTKS